MSSKAVEVVDQDQDALALTLVINKKNVFSSLDIVLAEVTEQVKIPDEVTSEKDAKALRSLAQKVVKTKTSICKNGPAAEIIDEMSSKLTERRNQMKNFEADMDDLRDKIKAPAIAYEQRETLRKQKHQDLMMSIEGMADVAYDATPQQLEEAIAGIKALVEDHYWEEYKTDGDLVVQRSLEKLDAMYDTAVRKQEQDAENAELRARIAELEAAQKSNSKAEQEDTPEFELEVEQDDVEPKEVKHPAQVTIPAIEQITTHFINMGYDPDLCHTFATEIVEGKVPCVTVTE